MAQTASSIIPEDDLSRFGDRLDRISSTMDGYDYLRAVANESGFRHFSLLRFGLEADDGFARQTLFSSLPQSVIRDLDDDNRANGGGSMSAARRTFRPVAWDRVLPYPHRAGNDNRSGGAILARVGVTMGVSLPVSSWRAVRGLVLFGGERALPGLQEVARLSLMANGLFDRLVEIEGEQPGTCDYRLTMRERQCLTWTSAGKTSAEIAGILGLSEHTINQYITSSGQKLGAVNRTQAVAKAIRLRLID
jgi:DNA-binding CsgD family transcriptional regulator